MLRTSFTLITLLVLVASCSPIVDTRGHQWEKGDFKQIIQGQSGKEDVTAVLGTPSTTSDFGQEVWYYIALKKERQAFFAPKVSHQEIVAVTFDDDGHVDAISRFNTKDKKEVVMVGKATPAEGQKLGIIEQFLGNLGRFNSPGRQPGALSRP